MSRPLIAACLTLSCLAALADEGGPETTVTCDSPGIHLQVLGSGGPELQDRRASSSYLVWIDGNARVLVDIGGGAALRFGESGAVVADLDVILLTHLHADHTSDLPALVKSSWFEQRTRPLPIYGPTGNRIMPSTVAFVRALFDSTRGAYRYLGPFLSPLSEETYKLEPHNVRDRQSKFVPERRRGDNVVEVFRNDRIIVRGIRVAHGQIPAIAWRIEAKGKAIVFGGDMNGTSGNLEKLARGAALLVAHNAVPEGASGVGRELHMPPSVIGRIARDAGVKDLVLSHRMLRTLGKEDETREEIRKKYAGPITFANDLDCFSP